MSRRPPLEERIARQVVAIMRAEGLVSADREETPWADDETTDHESSGRSGYRAAGSTESSLSRRARAKAIADNVLSGVMT